MDLKQTKKDQVKIATTFSYVKSIIPNIELCRYAYGSYFLVHNNIFPIPIKVSSDDLNLQETFEKLNSYNNGSYIKLEYPFIYKDAIADDYNYSKLVLNKQDFVNSDLFKNNFNTLPSWIFQYESKIDNVTLPSNLTTISQYAFYGCLCNNINLPKSLEHICSGAFWGCSSLSSLNIPENIKTIDSFAFGLCRHLKEIVFLGNNISSIGKDIFSGSSNLQRVYTSSLKLKKYIRKFYKDVEVIWTA